jgi:hemerythrin
MSLLVWSNLFSVGVKDIDDQHKKLVELANKLNDEMAAGRGKDVLGRILTELISYTQYHFSFEEKLMATHSYTASAGHKEQHKQLVTAVADLKKKYDSGESNLTNDVMVFLRDWLTKHILNTDKALGRELNQKGIR